MLQIPENACQFPGIRDYGMRFGSLKGDLCREASKLKGKVLPYSLPSVDSSLQAVSPQAAGD